MSSGINGPAQRPPKRKVVEQAMAVLRETRAKFDPAVLEVVRHKLSALVPAALLASTNKPPEPAAKVPPEVPVFTKPKEEELENTPKRRASTQEAAARYVAPKAEPIKAVKEEQPKELDPTMEKVDRQKISKIVLEYMKLRNDKTPGH